MVSDAKGPKDKVSGRVRALRAMQADPDPEIRNPEAPQEARGMYVYATVYTPSTRGFREMSPNITVKDTVTDTVKNTVKDTVADVYENEGHKYGHRILYLSEATPCRFLRL